MAEINKTEQWLIEWEDGGGRCEECRRNKYCTMKTRGGCGPQKRHRKKEQEELIKQLMNKAKEAQEKATVSSQIIDGEYTEVEPSES